MTLWYAQQNVEQGVFKEYSWLPKWKNVVGIYWRETMCWTNWMNTARMLERQAYDKKEVEEEDQQR